MDTLTSYFTLPKVEIERTFSAGYGEIHFYAKSVSKDWSADIAGAFVTSSTIIKL